MLGQVFELTDIPTVGALAFLETLLSADNAIVLGVISSALPEKLQKKALFIGLFSAFFFRAIAIFFVNFLLKYPLIQAAGGAYLLYLSIRHFARKKERESLLPTGHRSFWKTVFLIELFDIAFAVDSIVAGIAFINTAPHEAIYHPKLWIVYIGGMIGVCTIRYAAHFFVLLNQRFAQLEMSAYLIVGWIGIKLALQAFDFSFPYFSIIFWSGLVLLFCLGFINKKKAA
jgi:YkoY family integral membrane protein